MRKIYKVRFCRKIALWWFQYTRCCSLLNRHRIPRTNGEAVCGHLVRSTRCGFDTVRYSNMMFFNESDKIFFHERAGVEKSLNLIASDAAQEVSLNYGLNALKDSFFFEPLAHVNKALDEFC